MQFKFQMIPFIFSQYQPMDIHSIFQKFLIHQIVLIPELINEFTVTLFFMKEYIIPHYI